MLTIAPCETMLSPGFSIEMWQKFFEGAFSILKGYGVEHYRTRYVINFGLGYQRDAQVMMDVLASKHEFPEFLPHKYGFEVGADGTINAPEDSIHKEVIDLIKKRSMLKGPGNDEVKERRRIDKEVLEHLPLLLVAP